MYCGNYFGRAFRLLFAVIFNGLLAIYILKLLFRSGQESRSWCLPASDSVCSKSCLLYTSSACGPVFGGQHDLAAEEAVGLVVQGGERTVSEAEKTHIEPVSYTHLCGHVRDFAVYGRYALQSP